MDPDPNWAKFLDPDLMYLDGSTLLVLCSPEGVEQLALSQVPEADQTW